MRIVTTSAVALGAALLLGLAGTSPSFAKAHSNGLGGNGAAGPMTAGKVDNLVSRDGALTTNGTYGGTVREQAQSGGRGKNDLAHDKSEGSGHPSTRSR